MRLHDDGGRRIPSRPLRCLPLRGEGADVVRSRAHACGDAARAMASPSLAIGDGALAGAAVHRSLVFEGLH